MIKVKIQGGLGNQLFQFCAGMNIAIQQQREIKFYWGHSGRDSVRRFSLGFLGIKPNVFYQPSIEDNKILLKPLARLNNLHIKTLSRFRLVEEKKFNFEELETSYDNVNLIGFFQSEKFFVENVGLLKPYLESYLRKFISDLEPQSKPINLGHALHLRFGDYLRFPYNEVHANLTPEYYLKGIETFVNWRPSEAIGVFSDDLILSRKFLSDSRFKGFKFHFWESHNEFIDLYSLAQINNIVIANSTFSWWGAYLGTPDKQIVAPANWFTPKFMAIHDTKDLFPSSWKKI
jgi:hypothetical protein